MSSFYGTIEEELPEWYIFRKPEDFEIDVKKWYEYAEKRIEKFVNSEQELWLLYRTTWMTEEQWREVIEEEIGGHYLLRLAVSRNLRLTSWLVEIEADLFEFRFVNSITFEEKISVLKHLYGEDNLLTIQELNFLLKENNILLKFGLVETGTRKVQYTSRRRTTKKRGGDLERYIAVKFDKIPKVVGARKALLYKGWAIVKIADIRLSTKRIFENKLRDIIKRSVEFLDKDTVLENTIEPIRKKIEEIAAKSSRKAFSDMDFFKDEKMAQRIDCYPPCIYELLTNLQSKGHLAHMENWQLGTFLKKVGMSIEEQKQFWYKNSIDNVGQSYEEFEKKVGYQIEHIYGLAGGGVDYEPPKCQTCIDGYFCFFAHESIEEISKSMSLRFSSIPEDKLIKTIDKITHLVVSGRYQEACSEYFKLHTGGLIGRRVNHMLMYTKRAYEILYGKNKKKEVLKEERKADEASFD